MPRVARRILLPRYVTELFYNFTANKLFRMAAAGDGNHAVKMNAMERIPRPFVIGVAGGTASGKVQTYLRNNFCKTNRQSVCHFLTADVKLC